MHIAGGVIHLLAVIALVVLIYDLSRVKSRSPKRYSSSLRLLVGEGREVDAALAVNAANDVFENFW